MAQVALKVRRTQQERSETTQARLLDATVDCLVEYGYAGTSTVVVAERAGVSRGAQLHHFPTRELLVTSAIVYLHERRVAEFKEAIGALPKGADRRSATIDLLWSMFASPTFDATLEIFVAARTNPELHAALLPVARRFVTTVDATARELFPEAQANPYFQVAMDLTMQLMQGMALDRIVCTDPAEHARLLDFLKMILTRIANVPPLKEASAPAAAKIATLPRQRPASRARRRK